MEQSEKQAHDAAARRVRYLVPADVAPVFDAEFLDEAFCRSWILKRLHPDGAVCPVCRRTLKPPRADRFWSGHKVRCTCGKYFSATTGTFLRGCHMEFRQVVLLAFLLALGRSNADIAAVLDLSPETVRLWRNKFDALTHDRNLHED